MDSQPWATRHRLQARQRISNKGRNLSTVAGPIPGTVVRASMLANGPCDSRYATIAAARPGPTPGSVAKSLAVAELRPILAGWAVCLWDGLPGRGTPEKRTWPSSRRSRPGPTPGRASSAAKPPKSPCAFRSSTIRRARSGPIPGSRAISAAGARSRSISSPSLSGFPARRALSRCASGEVESVPARTEIAPGASPGSSKAHRAAWPTTASPASSKTERYSGDMPAMCGAARHGAGSEKCESGRKEDGQGPSSAIPPAPPMPVPGGPRSPDSGR